MSSRRGCPWSATMKKMETMMHRVLVVGGGFGGVAAALALQKQHDRRLDITLVSDRPHFEYHAALYRVVAGRSPLEVCIPLSTIFPTNDVKVVEDKITTIDTEKNVALGQDGSRYPYDSLVFGVGSQTQYFGVPGLDKYSFGVKSITEALKLKRHLHELLTETAAQEKEPVIHIVVAGGGATGVEVAGELAVYTQKLARNHNLTPSQITIDLFEAGERLLGVMPKWTSVVAAKRLRTLGVNIYLNTAILKEQVEEVYLPDMKMRTKTVIWTAGVGPNDLTRSLKGVTLTKPGKIEVDGQLRAKGLANFYVVGDAAATKFSGMAQTALRDGQFVAETIIRQLQKRPLGANKPIAPSYAIPIGPGWALVEADGLRLTGKIGWFFRRWADWRFFRKILPMNAAVAAFKDGQRLSETCPACLTAEKESTVA